MAEMTSRERVVAALNHQEPDRVQLHIELVELGQAPGHGSQARRQGGVGDRGRAGTSLGHAFPHRLGSAVALSPRLSQSRGIVGFLPLKRFLATSLDRKSACAKIPPRS